MFFQSQVCQAAAGHFNSGKSDHCSLQLLLQSQYLSHLGNWKSKLKDRNEKCREKLESLKVWRVSPQVLDPNWGEEQRSILPSSRFSNIHL